MAGTALTMPEREEIPRGLVDEETLTDIAGRIGRHTSTVSAVARHGGPDDYRSYQAHVAAREARRRPQPRKLATNGRLRGEVEVRLEKKYSPEQIADRLVEDFPDDEAMGLGTTDRPGRYRHVCRRVRSRGTRP